MELRNTYDMPVEERQSCELKHAKEPTITEDMAHTFEVLKDILMSVRSMEVMLFGGVEDCCEKIPEPSCAKDNSRMNRGIAIEIYERLEDIRRRL